MPFRLISCTEFEWAKLYLVWGTDSALGVRTEIPFLYGDRLYQSTIQCFAAQKALAFGELELYNKIVDEKENLGPVVKDAFMKLCTLHEQKPTLHQKWNDMRPLLLLHITLHRILYDDAAVKALTESGTALIGSCETTDALYDIGCPRYFRSAITPYKWGDNVYGQVLMTVRTILQQCQMTKWLQMEQLTRGTVEMDLSLFNFANRVQVRLLGHIFNNFFWIIYSILFYDRF